MVSDLKRPQKKTPKGTPPMPMRVKTKHKHPAFGALLMAKAAARRARKVAS